MKNEGPQLDALLHRLADTPPSFLEAPRQGERGEVHVAAVVGDLLVSFGRLPDADSVSAFRTDSPDRRNWLRLVLLGAWLAHDDWFLARRELADPILRHLTEELEPLAAVVQADAFVSHPDRREEFVRLLLHSLDLRPAGESVEQSADRLQTVSTIDREAVLAELKEKRERAKKLREEMAKKRAREAATRYSRE